MQRVGIAPRGVLAADSLLFEPLTANRFHLLWVGSGPRHDIVCLRQGRDHYRVLPFELTNLGQHVVLSLPQDTASPLANWPTNQLFNFRVAPSLRASGQLSL